MKTFNIEFGKKEVYRFVADASDVQAKFGGSYKLIQYLESGMDALKDLSHTVDFNCDDLDHRKMIISFYAITDPIIIEQ